MAIGDVKTYLFQNLSSSNSGNVTLAASSFPIKGQIEKVMISSGQFSNNGSLHVYISGNSLEPDELLLGVNQCSGNRVFYPRTVVCGSGGTAFSAGDNLAGHFIANNKLYYWGSGCGATKTGCSLTIFYR